MRTHASSRLIVAVLSLNAFLLIASRARAVAPPDFSLGPSTLTVGVESDSTADGGCMATTNDGCDSFKFKVPITLNPNGDIRDDIQIPDDEIGIGISTSDFCSVGGPDFSVIVPHSSLIMKETTGEVKISFSGMAEAESLSASAMVPVKVLIQINRVTRQGFFMASGFGDLTPLHGNSSAFVGLFVTEGDSDGDTDFGCTSMTQKNKRQN